MTTMKLFAKALDVVSETINGPVDNGTKARAMFAFGLASAHVSRESTNVFLRDSMGNLARVAALVSNSLDTGDPTLIKRAMNVFTDACAVAQGALDAAKK